jgi:2-polyprenyl-6-hydroxyphenyl methylase / 3-demethylubiquinone-9 3-methyltransferase
MELNTHHGGSIKWWPPSGDLVFLYKLNPLRFEYFDRFMGNWNGIKVLDVGCGGGYACEFLARRNAMVFGTDIMTESLEQARDHCVQEKLEIEYHPCTPERLPFDDNSMDAATCFDVLEHIPNKDQTLREIHRVLKPGGWFFYDTFNKTFWSKLFIIWLGEHIIRFMPKGTHYWPWFIHPAELKSRLENIGFSSVEYGGIKRYKNPTKKRNPPVMISPQGSTAVIYFGAAKKQPFTGMTNRRSNRP